MPKDCSFFANADAYGCEADFPKWFGMSGKIKDYCRASCNICDSDGKYFDNTNVYLRLRGILYFKTKQFYLEYMNLSLQKYG